MSLYACKDGDIILTLSVRNLFLRLCSDFQLLHRAFELYLPETGSFPEMSNQKMCHESSW